MTAALPSHTQFSGHETFPLRQLWLRKAYLAFTRATGAEKAPVNARDIFAPEIGIREFGVGKNMVAAIRHWALACDVLQEEKGMLSAGTVGRALLAARGGLDPSLQ